MIALFGGKSKQKMAKFLSEFGQELKELLSRSVVNINGKQYNLSVFCFVCDAPARALLKGIVQHTGYYSCERCTQRGMQKHKRTVFDDLEENVTLRNNDMFCNHSYSFPDTSGKQHQHSYSCLLPLPINFTQDFVLDYMHLVCLGVVHRILYF